MRPVARTTWYATYPAGFAELIVRILREDYPGVSVSAAFDDAVVLDLDSSAGRRVRSPYFHNVFVVLDRIHTPAGRGDMEPALSLFSDRLASYDLQHALRGYRSFRLVVSDENRLVSVDAGIRNRLERAISNHARIPIHNRRPDTDVWIARRRDGLCLFMVRSPGSTPPRADLPKGSLTPQLGSLLCRLSGPADQDVFLDPFCGHGGIFVERLRWKYRLAFALDEDPDRVQDVKARLQERSRQWRSRTYVRQGNGTRLAGFSDDFITSIVTDPPWGLYGDRPLDLDAFYSGMLRSFARVLTNRGRLVVLVARHIPLEQLAAGAASALSMKESFPVLVNGRKATVHRLEKR